MPQEKNANTDKAKQLNSDGISLLNKGKLDEAEEVFRQALAADVDYGPAHNNLGQVYLKRHQLYLAAWEFQFASNLMVQRPEPLFNLGLVYETANRLLDAKAVYESALALAPDNAAVLGNLARVCIKLDDDPARIQFLLNELVMHDNRPQWLKWAKDLLATKYQGLGVSVQAMETFSEMPSAPSNAQFSGGMPQEFVPPPMAPSSPPATGFPQSEELPLPASQLEGALYRASPIDFAQPGYPQAQIQESASTPIMPVTARTVELPSSVLPAPQLPLPGGAAWPGFPDVPIAP